MSAITDLAPWLDLGISGVLVGVIVWLIRKRESLVSSGDWVPKRELDYLRQDRDARLAEKDAQIARERQVGAEWRAAHETSERTRELLNTQNRDLIDALRAPQRFFDAFQSVLERDEDHTAGDSPTGPSVGHHGV